MFDGLVLISGIIEIILNILLNREEVGKVLVIHIISCYMYISYYTVTPVNKQDIICLKTYQDEYY